MPNLAPHPITLHRIEIKSPCTASWAEMQGDERERHCGDCNKSVFNLSAMTGVEASALLAGNVDGRLCVRFYQRPDGTVMTGDCSTSARAFAKRTLRKLPAMAGSAVLALSVAGCAGGADMVVHEPQSPMPMQGEPVQMMGAPPVTDPDDSVHVPTPTATELPADQEPAIMGKPAFPAEAPSAPVEP